MMQEKNLFGDSVQVLVPLNFIDVYDFRQVPDNQEVFINPDTNDSIIFELLETPESAELLSQGISAHWDELSQHNSSLQSSIQYIKQVSHEDTAIDRECFCQVLKGNQVVPKFGKLSDKESAESMFRAPCKDLSLKMSANRDDYKKQKMLDEARKAGKAPALVDEEGHAINPHIPDYIVKAPWYMNTGQPSLKHQRTSKRPEPTTNESQTKGFVQPDSDLVKFRKGACENCGAMTHKTKECLDRPRKVGAKYSGADMKPDEYLIEGPQDYDGKRDRWAAFDPEEYDQVVETYEKVDEERRKLKESETDVNASALTADLPNDADKSEPNELANDDKYAEAVDMPGQKVDTKTRMTVRNLRIREDTAKYLRNLDIDSAYYDPKTRSMRENPNPDVDPDKLMYAGDNFIRMSGESKKVTDLQLFAWQAFERGEDISLQANPSEIERLYQQHVKTKEGEKRKLEESLVQKYGDQDDVYNGEDDSLCEESDVYMEYSKNGKILRAERGNQNF